MTLKRRSLVMVGFLAFAAAAYGIARRSASAMVFHVVEQSLIQKAPADVGEESIRRRLNELLRAAPDEKARMRTLLRISQDLEKVQKLTRDEWTRLWPQPGSGDLPGIGHQGTFPLRKASDR